MNILKELLALKELGINTVTFKQHQGCTNGLAIGHFASTHTFLTQTLENYRIEIFLNTTQDELETKIKNAKQFLEDRRDYQVTPPNLVEIFDKFKQ